MDLGGGGSRVRDLIRHKNLISGAWTFGVKTNGLVLVKKGVYITLIDPLHSWGLY